MVKKPEFVPTISFGNVVQICLTLLALGTAWGAMQAKVAGLENKQAANLTILQGDLKETGDSYRDLAARMRDLENQSARTDERFNLLLTMLAEIKAQVNTLTDTRYKD